MPQNPESGPGPISADDEWVLDRAVQGDQQAFAHLFDRYHDRVHRYFWRRLSCAEDAEDLTQDVFLLAWRALGRYRRGTTPFIAWLLSIAHNSLMSFYRHKKASPLLETEVSEDERAERIEEPVDSLVEHERALRAMAWLRPEQQRVLSMRFVDDLDCKQVAANLGKSEGNVRLIQYRALHQLRQIMEAEKHSSPQ